MKIGNHVVLCPLGSTHVGGGQAPGRQLDRVATFSPSDLSLSTLTDCARRWRLPVHACVLQCHPPKQVNLGFTRSRSCCRQPLPRVRTLEDTNNHHPEAQ